MGMNFNVATHARGATEARVCGSLDSFDPLFGLTGWCADLSDAAVELEVELLVNGAPVATARAETWRRDVCETIGMQGRFGFCFDAAVFDAFLPNKAVFARKDYGVRVAGQASMLQGRDQLPDLGALLEAREAWLRRGEGQALIESLELMRESAHELMFQRPGKTAADADGVIEAIALGAGNVVWFLGWTSSRGNAEFPAVVLDRRKYAAGLRCAYYRRADLAEPAIGIVGALLSDWRPSTASDALIVFGDRAQNLLRTVRPLRVTTPAEMFGHLQAHEDADSRLLARQLLEIAVETDGWSLETPASKTIRIAVDSAQFIEGFGVFMKGWIVSPSHRVKSMALKLGEDILEGAPTSLHFSPRPDLTPAFPAMGAAIERAGFTVVFRGDLRNADFGAATLRLTHENNRSTHHRLVDLGIVRVPVSSDLVGLRDYYPVIEHEAFFPDLARAVYDSCAQDYRRALGEIVNPCARALIFCAPAERRLQYHLFAHLHEHLAGRRVQGVGVAIAAPDSARHGEIGELFAEFAQKFAGAASLVFVADVECAAWSLSSLLSLLDARRFVFVGADVLLGAAGWAALDRLVGDDDDLALFEISDPEQPWLPARIGSMAFSWSTQRWSRFARENCPPLRRAVDGETLAGAFAGEARRIAAGGDVLSRTPPPPRLIEHVNRVLGLGAS